MRRFSVLPIAAVALSESPVDAGDQDLQAALQRLNCLPARIKSMEFAVKVTAYEVICKGAQRIVTVVCAEGTCREQAKAREEDEGGKRDAANETRVGSCTVVPFGSAVP